jgi:hypothetical protein
VNSLLDGTGVYEDVSGYTSDRLVHRTAFDTAACRLGRVNGPALLMDLFYSGALNLCGEDMVGVVADIWSSAEYPEDALDWFVWVDLFHENGYNDDGKAAAPPTDPVTLYRGCAYELRTRMAWTSDIRVAERFAYGGIRGRRPGEVWTATVHPEGLLAYIGREIGRNESELVVDPGYLDDVRLWESAA